MRKLLTVVAMLVAGSGLAFACLSKDSAMPTTAPVRPKLLASGPIRKVAPKKAGPRMRLESFAPLLTRSQLASVRGQIDDSNFEAAAASLAALVQSSPPAVEDAPRFEFLLGRVLEKAGKLAAAKVHFERASRASFPLTDYANVAVARVLLGLGAVDQAEQQLARVRLEAPLTSQGLRLRAAIGEKLGHFTESVEALRLLTSTPDPDPELLIQLAEVLLATISGDALRVAADVETDLARAQEALKVSRQAQVLSPESDSLGERVRAVGQQLRARFAARHLVLDERASPEEMLMTLTVLVQRRLFEPAILQASELTQALGAEARFSPLGCSAWLLHAKALAGTNDYSKATDLLTDPLRFCKGESDFRAKLLFVAGKYGAAAGRHAFAARIFEQLEAETPQNSLADDARVRAAQSYRKLGSEARFIELLTTITDDYPSGDTTLDGVFALALSRIEKGDWAAAAATLDRVHERAKTEDPLRGQEFAGRERYFSARAWIETGELARGLAEYEAILDELPLSYYMLHAYSRLRELDAARAASVLSRALSRAREQPFSFEERPEYSTPGFQRAMELLGLGEVEWAKRELAELGLDRSGGPSPGALWGVALLYNKAGSVDLAHSLARSLLTDWFEHWPAGDWEQAWRIAFPTPYPVIVTREVARSGTPAFFAYAIMREESAFDSQAKSTANAFGLMQLIVPTAKMVAQPLGLPYDSRALLKPAVNIRLGTTLLAKLTQEFSTNPLLAIPGYNAGPSRPRQWLKANAQADFDVWVELMPFYETRRYTKRVLASRAAYAWLYENARADEALVLPKRLN